MSKKTQLKKVVIINAVRCTVVVGLFAGLYFLTDDQVTSSGTEKTNAESALNTDKTQISGLTNQLEASGIADKRYLETQQERSSVNFMSDTDALKACLRDAKARYRLSNNLKLSLTQDKLSTKSDLAGSNYEIVEHPGMKLSLSAMSDTHTYSLLSDLRHSCPGFIRIDALRMKRTADIDADVINQMRSGQAVYTVDTTVEFNWIALREKAPKDSPPPAAANAPAAAPTAEAK